MSRKPIFPEPWESAWGEGDIALGQQDEVRLAADASEDGTVRIAIERITKAMREIGVNVLEAEDAAHADIVLALDATAVEFADKNADQAFRKSLKHFTGAEDHLMKAQLTKAEAKQLDKIKNHLADGNKAFDAFVKAYDTDHPKNAEQKLNKAIESYQKAMDLI